MNEADLLKLFKNPEDLIQIEKYFQDKGALMAISPIDGRYAKKTKELSKCFSEYGLIRYRVYVQTEYSIAIVCRLDAIDLDNIKPFAGALMKILKDFSIDDAMRIKAIEKITNHDVKAIEYFLQEKLEAIGLEKYVNLLSNVFNGLVATTKAFFSSLLTTSAFIPVLGSVM